MKAKVKYYLAQKGDEMAAFCLEADDTALSPVLAAARNVYEKVWEVEQKEWERTRRQIAEET